MKTIFRWKLGILVFVLLQTGNCVPIDELAAGSNEDRDSKTFGLLIALRDAVGNRKIDLQSAQKKILTASLPKISIELGQTISGDISALTDDGSDAGSSQRKPPATVTVVNNLKIAYGKSLMNNSDVSKNKNIKEEEVIINDEEVNGLQPSAGENAVSGVTRRTKRQSNQLSNEDIEDQSTEDLKGSGAIEPSSFPEETMTITTMSPTTSTTVPSSIPSGTPSSSYGPPSSGVSGGSYVPPEGPSSSYGPPPSTNPSTGYGPPASASPSSGYGPPPPVASNNAYGAPSPTSPSNHWSITNPSSSTSYHPSSGSSNPIWTLGYGPSKFQNINEISLTQDHLPVSGERRHYHVYPGSSSYYYAYPYYPLYPYYSHHFKPSFPDHYRNFWDWSSKNFVPIYVNQWQSTPLWPANDFNTGNFKWLK